MEQKSGTKFSNVTVVNHPLVAHKLTIMRDKNTKPKEFRELTKEIAMLLAFEATRDLPTENIEIETPLMKSSQPVLKGKAPCLVPILRAGLGFLDGFLSVLPNAKVGHIGLSRNHDLTISEYYCKLPPDVKERPVIILDPMLGTAGTAIQAVKMLQDRGITNIRMVVLVTIESGIKKFNEKHSDIPLYVAAIDDRLSEIGYIEPGLGDAGDRTFGTVDH